ncbi:hypothetical protein EYF80_006202 [Liparis tanakae]|uniref:Uncharacterized protein n=1 Tax=Liparis tanakae TaxID=230148 RepID=A0A4Z2J1J8_9TELE|nr:hypothetical protein EYF80_006202 [Liparis tanakae]
MYTPETETRAIPYPRVLQSSGSGSQGLSWSSRCSLHQVLHLSKYMALSTGAEPGPESRGGDAEMGPVTEKESR